MKAQKKRVTFKKVLPNGVKLYMCSDKNLKRIYASYEVRYGLSGMFNSVLINGKEEKLPFGMAHFLEHTILEHSVHGNLLHEFMSKNYSFNGVTGDRYTRYYILGYKDMKESIKKLIEAVDIPVFTPEDLEKVKPAVIEELTKNFDRKYSKAFACIGRNLYSGYEEKPATLNSLDSAETTEKFNYEIVKKAYDAYYYDANKTLVIAGNIDIDDMLKFLDEVYKNIKPHKQIAETIYYDKFEVRKTREVLYEDMHNDYMILAFKRKYTEKKNILKEKIYRMIYYALCFDENEDFQNKLNDEKIIIGRIGTEDDVFNNINELYFITDILDENRFREELIKYLKTNIDSIKKEDFELYKKNLVASTVVEWDNPYAVFMVFPRNLEYYDEFDSTPLMLSLDFEEFKNHIKSINYDTYTSVILKNK